MLTKLAKHRPTETVTAQPDWQATFRIKTLAAIRLITQLVHGQQSNISNYARLSWQQNKQNHGASMPGTLQDICANKHL
jgi:hypothetical protein